MGYRIGVDVGGTFTDICVFDENTGGIEIQKVPSSTHDPAEAIIEGVEIITREKSLPKDEINYFVHGTTIGTNTAIERKGAKTALLTTYGFRDLLEIGRQTRPSLYNLYVDKPKQLIPRKWRREITERILSDGSIYRELDIDSAEEVIDSLIKEGVEAVSVCFLHSYLNPVHEKKIKELIIKKFPNVYISISSEVLPEYREYERLSTTTLNSYIGPVVSNYVDKLEKGLKGTGIKVKPYIYQSNGGLMSVTTTKSNPVRTALSGPSAGVAGAIYVSKLAGFRNVITLDMGGTSTDVCLIQDLQENIATGKKVAGFPLHLPMTDIHAVGAGGGSIAWIDSGGILKVGPESAGAVPGPVCYGRGGEEPTVTDANVMLKRLNPNRILGGKMQIDLDGAENAIKNKLAKHLNMDAVDVAKGIIKVVNSNMVRAIRVVSVERGYDPREFTLMAYGGAGPIHAVDIARELGIKTVLVPRTPGILSALGLLVSDLKMDFVKTRILMADAEDFSKVKSELDNLDQKVLEWFEEEGIESEKRRVERGLDMRYKGQNYELTIELDNDLETIEDLKTVINKFHTVHNRMYEYANRDEQVEIVNFRATAFGEIEKAELKGYSEEQNYTAEKIVDKRNVFFQEVDQFVPTNIYNRDLINSGDRIEGPAIIEQVDSTIVIPPKTIAKVDQYKNIILELEAR